ncbi:MAG TPA: macro domain-containing protein [Planktothrix sp.]
MALTIHLCDQNEEVVKALNNFFGRNARVEISQADVLDLSVSVLVVPTNSFGILDSGLAAALNKKTNGALEPRVRKLILDKYAGELPVGWADIIISGIDNPKQIIVAPTLRVPIRMNSANVNSYLATRGALRMLAAHMRQEREEKGETSIESVALVGMGTGTGKTAPATAAFQMYEAYCQIVLGQEPNFATMEAATAHDAELRKSRFI